MVDGVPTAGVAAEDETVSQQHLGCAEVMVGIRAGKSAGVVAGGAAGRVKGLHNTLAHGPPAAPTKEIQPSTQG